MKTLEPIFTSLKTAQAALALQNRRQEDPSGSGYLEPQGDTGFEAHGK
jgi:hypothetical protein